MDLPVSDPIQQSIPLDHFEAVIEARATEALVEIREMAREAIEFINRSTGQKLRYLRAQNEAFIRGEKR